MTLREQNIRSFQAVFNRESKHHHTDHEDVIELLYAIDFGQQLVDDGVVDAGAARHAPSLLADGIDLIEDDDVHAAVRPELSGRKTRQERHTSPKTISTKQEHLNKLHHGDTER